MIPQTASTRLEPAVHQTEALTRLADWFQQRHTSYAGAILVLPTGGGKTFTAVQFLCSPTGPRSQGYKVPRTNSNRRPSIPSMSGSSTTWTRWPE